MIRAKIHYRKMKKYIYYCTTLLLVLILVFIGLSKLFPQYISVPGLDYVSFSLCSDFSYSNENIYDEKCCWLWKPVNDLVPLQNLDVAEYSMTTKKGVLGNSGGRGGWARAARSCFENYSLSTVNSFYSLHTYARILPYLP